MVDLSIVTSMASMDGWSGLLVSWLNQQTECYKGRCMRGPMGV